MKIKEILVRSLMNTKLFEMAYERKQAINILVGIQDHIAEHLVKLFMYSGDRNVSHWKSEVDGALRRINRMRLKSSNDYLDKSTLFDYLFTQPVGTIDDVQVYMNDISRSKDYRGLRIDQPDAREIHKQILFLMDDVTDELSTGTFRSISPQDE